MRTSAVLTLMMPAAPKPWITRATASAVSEPGQRAAERRNGEQRQPGHIHAPVADPVAERGERQQRDGDGELIRVDDPDRVGGTRVQVAGDGGKRDVGDGAVEHGERDAERDDQNGPIALGKTEGLVLRPSIGKKWESGEV